MKKILIILTALFTVILDVTAQEVVDTTYKSAIFIPDSALVLEDSVLLKNEVLKDAAKGAVTKVKRNWEEWRPDIKKAMWLAIVIPGGGQIYNRKFWKLPIIYGGLVGCAYALRWNGQMYDSYSRAYEDIMQEDGGNKSYQKFVHTGTDIESNKSYWQEVFKRRKNKFRRWRDMSFFCMIGVYGLSIIDAYVDASLSQFDISEDLSLKITPAYINGQGQNLTASRSNSTSLSTGGLGVRCKLNF